MMEPTVPLWGILVAVVVGFGLSVGVSYWLSRRQAPPPRWEMFEVEPSTETPMDASLRPGPARVGRRRIVEAVDTSAPWDRERPTTTPGIVFPGSWQHEFPDAPPTPARLPDEEDERP